MSLPGCRFMICLAVLGSAIACSNAKNDRGLARSVVYKPAMLSMADVRANFPPGFTDVATNSGAIATLGGCGDGALGDIGMGTTGVQGSRGSDGLVIWVYQDAVAALHGLMAAKTEMHFRAGRPCTAGGSSLKYRVGSADARSIGVAVFGADSGTSGSEFLLADGNLIVDLFVNGKSLDSVRHSAERIAADLGVLTPGASPAVTPSLQSTPTRALTTTTMPVNTTTAAISASLQTVDGYTYSLTVSPNLGQFRTNDANQPPGHTDVVAGPTSGTWTLTNTLAGDRYAPYQVGVLTLMGLYTYRADVCGNAQPLGSGHQAVTVDGTQYCYFGLARLGQDSLENETGMLRLVPGGTHTDRLTSVGAGQTYVPEDYGSFLVNYLNQPPAAYAISFGFAQWNLKTSCSFAFAGGTFSFVWVTSGGGHSPQQCQ